MSDLGQIPVPRHALQALVLIAEEHEPNSERGRNAIIAAKHALEDAVPPGALDRVVDAIFDPTHPLIAALDDYDEGRRVSDAITQRHLELSEWEPDGHDELPEDELARTVMYAVFEIAMSDPDHLGHAVLKGVDWLEVARAFDPKGDE